MGSNDYRRANLPRYAALQKQWRRRHPREAMLIGARSRAKKFGIPFAITVADVVWNATCPVFGMTLRYGCQSTGSRGDLATLDRKDNSAGYVPGNVVVISHRANRLKQDATRAEVVALLQYMDS